MTRYQYLVPTIVIVVVAATLLPTTAGAWGLSDPLNAAGGLSAGCSGALMPFRPHSSNKRRPSGGGIENPLGVIEAIVHALRANPQTRQSWAKIKEREAQFGISRSAYLPTVKGTFGIKKSQEETSVIHYPQLSVHALPITASGTLTLNYVLYDFGHRRADLENARELLKAIYATYNETLQTVFFNAAQAYYDAIAAKGSLNAAIAAEQSAKKSYLAALAKNRAGVGTLEDTLQAKTAWEKAVLNRVKDKGEFGSAIGSLAIVMGLKANTPITLEKINKKLPGVKFMRGVNALIAEAERQQPRLVAAKAQLSATEAQERSMKRQGFPTISLSASLSDNEQFHAVPGDTINRNNTIGVRINVPLFTGFRRLYQIHKVRAQIKEQEANLSNIKQQISLDVWKAYQELKTDTEGLKAASDLSQSAQHAFKVAQGRYDAGVGNILELLNAQSALANADQQRIQALSKWYVSRLKLLASLGKLGFWAINRSKNKKCK